MFAVLPSAPLRSRARFRTPRLFHGAALAGIALLGGCAFSPAYQRPAPPVESAFPTEGVYAQAQPASSGATVAGIGWREFFRDPILHDLIEDALQNNRDIRIAALNVEAARAIYRIQRAESAPQLDGVASSASQRTPGPLTASGTSEIARAHQMSATVAAWELDLWGRIRSLNDQALASYLAQKETRNSAELALIAETANAYLTFRADQALLRLAEETVETRRQSHALMSERVAVGEASLIEVRQAEAELRGAEAEREAYARQVARDRNALALLAGGPLTPEQNAALDLDAGFSDDWAIADLPPGLPSELLLRRPDVRAAEQALMAANAHIGAARAAFFPTVSLTGSIGTASNDLDDLFSSGARAWSFTPQITAPIFRGGALRANLERARLMEQIEVARYERTIQAAFRDVADGLAGQATLNDQIRAEGLRVAASETAYRMAEQRYREGEDSYLFVLEAQRTLYGAQQALIRARLTRQSNLTNLYKALGGGWVEHAA
ncbi:efflux transporter outer membrane subunit [Brevundimonas sp. 357]|uniref:efflux transporter outer membrane subunit n=1 Tax=Brevundimonas sp. 357 TaxID=2555782 RepID=UPI000F781203|nr:efflux transporter outer membrane subunit [Brevundimonas sp. 357]RSB42745.1 efflux transporter outer membrane subunit [Brevundimonas sp. 357]